MKYVHDFVATHASFPIRTRIVIIILFVDHDASFVCRLVGAGFAIVVSTAAATFAAVAIAGTPSAATTAGSSSRSTATAAACFLITGFIERRLQESRVVQFVAPSEMVFIANRALGSSFLPSSIVATTVGIVVAYSFQSASTDRLKFGHTAFQTKFLLNSLDILGYRAIFLDPLLQCVQFRNSLFETVLPNIVIVIIQAIQMLGSHHIYQNILQLCIVNSSVGDTISVSLLSRAVREETV